MGFMIRYATNTIILFTILLLHRASPAASSFPLPFISNLIPIWPIGGQEPELDPGSESEPEPEPNPTQSPPPGQGDSSLGRWKIVSEDPGVSAMHLVIMKNDKAIMFDATNLGPSHVMLPEGVPCRPDPTGKSKELDCWAHAVEFDIKTYAVRPLKVLTDTWCSAGGLDANGRLVQTGGWRDGGKAVRYLEPCDTCDWQEYPNALSAPRWYGTQQILPDGSFIVLGGRRQFNFEYVPSGGQSSPVNIPFPLLRETTDMAENNLYPFVYVNTDGNLFVFANTRGVILNPKTNQVLRELPPLSGGARNYPGSAMSALLPLDLRNNGSVRAEVIICGGADPNASQLAQNKTYVPALKSCGRMVISDPQPKWVMEDMPIPRVMGDMLILPTGDLLMINGASLGAAGWLWATNPVFAPLMYRPTAEPSQRFTKLARSNIPRMYHSTSAVLPDGSILIAGSNPNMGYMFENVDFKTEMRVEKFYPPYLDESLVTTRPTVSAPASVHYGGGFRLTFNVEEGTSRTDIMVSMYAPPFTTHGTSMNQRMLLLKIKKFIEREAGVYTIAVAAPPAPELAPPGYYMLFVVNRGVPSEAAWIKLRQR